MKAAACSLCKQRIAKYTCTMCGSNVCEVCFEITKGVCVACSRGKVLKK